MGRHTSVSVPYRRARAVRTALAIAACLVTLVGASPVPSSPPSPAPSLAPSATAGSTPSASSAPAAAGRPLVFAYYYIWYAPTSWRRAKIDLPQLGSYDSRDRAVIAQHIAWARAAGIDGLIVSWKHEQRLDDALSVLVDEATKAGMKLILLYQGLDFDRLPLDDAVVAGDLTWFMDNYAQAAPFDVYGKPMIVWSGTWGYKDSQIERVRTAIGAPERALLLGSERSADAYASRAQLFDGDAYYWSSPDPLTTPRYLRRLDEVAAAVRADSGRWIAPAAPGFDGRLIGGTSVVPRRDGATYRAAWDGALGTNPDILGIISWNEFSENSHIEPSKTYGDEYIKLTTELIAGLPSGGSSASPSASPADSLTPSSNPPFEAPFPADPVPAPRDTNLSGLVVGGAILVAFVVVGRILRRRSVP
jgi:hypothetical protein